MSSNGCFSRPAVYDWIEGVAIFLGLCIMGFALNFYISSDGEVRYQMMQMLVDQHRIANYPYSILQSVIASPLYILGKLTGHPQEVIERFNLIVFGLMLLVVYRRLSASTDPRLLRSWFLVMLSCSMYAHHFRMFYTEVLSAACILVGLASIVASAPVTGALALCIGVINTPALIVPLALVVAWLAWTEKKLWYFVIPVDGYPLDSGRPNR